MHVSEGFIEVVKDDEMIFQDFINDYDLTLTVANVVADLSKKFDIPWEGSLVAELSKKSYERFLREYEVLTKSKHPARWGYVIGLHSKVTLAVNSKGETMKRREDYISRVVGRKIDTGWYMTFFLSKEVVEAQNTDAIEGMGDVIFLLQAGKKVQKIPGDCVTILLSDLAEDPNHPHIFLTKKGLYMLAKRAAGITVGLLMKYGGKELVRDFQAKFIVATTMRELPRWLWRSFNEAFAVAKELGDYE